MQHSSVELFKMVTIRTTKIGTVAARNAAVSRSRTAAHGKAEMANGKLTVSIFHIRWANWHVHFRTAVSHKRATSSHPMLAGACLLVCNESLTRRSRGIEIAL